jgi:hypothetical protein
MTTNRVPISRSRRASITDEALSLFIELEAVPKRQLRRPEWRAKSKLLARLLGLSVEFWAGESVNNNNSGPCRSDALARETWHRCREMRKQLLAAARLARPPPHGVALAQGPVVEPDHDRPSIQ